MSKNKKQRYLVFLKEKDGDDEVAFLYSDVERLLHLMGFEMEPIDMVQYVQHIVWYIVSASSPRDAIRKGYEEAWKEEKAWEEEVRLEELRKAALDKHEESIHPPIALKPSPLTQQKQQRQMPK
jgi:hypothetical protein